jgi:hypothetical protein
MKGLQETAGPSFFSIVFTPLGRHLGTWLGPHVVRVAWTGNGRVPRCGVGIPGQGCDAKALVVSFGRSSMSKGRGGVELVGPWARSRRHC